VAALEGISGAAQRELANQHPSATTSRSCSPLPLLPLLFTSRLEGGRAREERPSLPSAGTVVVVATASRRAFAAAREISAAVVVAALLLLRTTAAADGDDGAVACEQGRVRQRGAT